MGKKMCKVIKFDGSTDKLLLHLAHATSGKVTWQEVRFLEEMFVFKQEDPPEKGSDEEEEDDEEEEERVGPSYLMPKRKPPPPPGGDRPHGQFPGFPARTMGEGPLATWMRPNKAVLSKSTSLPNIQEPIRAKWNDRHQIPDTKNNKSEQIIHLMAYVKTQESERIQRRVKQRMIEVPTGQWISQHMLAQEDEDYEEDND